MATIQTRRMLAAAVAACEDKKAEEISILELDSADSGLTDFFLIASATNERQAQAIADEIEFRLKKDFKVYANSVEGRRRGEWVLLDYVDFVAHIFLAEKRAYYDIARLRKSARAVDREELKAILSKKKPAAKSEPAKPKPVKTVKTATVKKTAVKTAKKKATAVKPVKKAAKKSSAAKK